MKNRKLSEVDEQITAKVSSIDGAGMDGGVGDISAFGGGELKMRICAKAIGGTEVKLRGNVEVPCCNKL